MLKCATSKLPRVATVARRWGCFPTRLAMRSYRRQTVGVFPRSGERSYRRQTVGVFPRSGERSYRRQTVGVFPRSGERSYWTVLLE